MRETTDEAKRGTVCSWFSQKGYGFIEGRPHHTKDVFFLAGAARSAPGEYIEFRRGDRVLYTTAIDDQGREFAASVRRLEGDR